METPDLDQFLHGEVFPPVAIVLASEAAQRSLLSKTGLSVSELLAPFGGYYTPLSVQYRVLDRSMRTDSFKLRFIEACDCQYTNSGEEEGMKIFKTRLQNNFFQQYFSAFCHGLKFAPFDCLSQPIASVLVVSSEEGDAAIGALEQLSHVANQPETCRSGLLDPTSTRVKILLHDKGGSVPDAQADAIIAQLNQIYTSNSVALLSFNSAPADCVDEIFNKKSVSSISFQDVETLSRVCEQIVTHNALPWLERKLQALDANITAKRKGLRNQLRNFLRNEPQYVSSANLSLQQVEWQCRLAGDIAFHLRAHETAFGYYRNVASDLKQDRSLLLASAGCYEMSALCALLGADSSASETARFAETAINLYREGGGAGNHVIRAAVVQGFVLRGRADAAEKLIKINGEILSEKSPGMLRSAILLSLAASLHSASGMKRKEAFTRVLAGHMFNKVEGGKELALEAYAAVLALYGPEWGFIRDHLLFTMAKLEFGLSHSPEALKLISELFRGGANRGTPEKHANYLKLLSYIAKSPDSIDDFPVPLINLIQKTPDQEDNITVCLHNPLMVALDLSSLQLIFPNPESAESETSGLISLAPGETKNVSLMVVSSTLLEPGSVRGVKWTLFDSLECRHVTGSH